MSNTDNTSPNPETHLADTETRPYSSMLVTLLLLIAGLLLSSVLMLHYGYKAGGEKMALPGVNFTELKEKGVAYQQQVTQPASDDPVAQEPPQKTEQESGGIGQLLAARGEKVRWPRLRLTGFGRSSDGTGGFAIINNQQVFLGELIDGKAKLIEVRTHDVVVEYKGETRIISTDL
ncbi:MAG: hypothetical protein HKP10_02455 [Kiritimatiellales bacterium]|nr:hypothetical protein [Pontiella sp.]NNJ70132.1 hypothetical protein [Kiritimatiellales bacterium]